MNTDTTSTTTSDSQIENDLRALAVRADAGEVLTLDESAGTQDTAAATETSTEGKTKTQPEAGAASSSTNAAAPTQTDPGKQPGEQKPKPESEYAKFQKDKERLSKSWQGIQAGQQELAQQREQLNRERMELQRLRSQQPVRTHETPEKPIGNPTLQKYSDDDLHQAAEDFEAKGQDEYAKIARKELALRSQSIARTQRTPVELPVDTTQQQQLQEHQRQEQFRGVWSGHLNALTAENPDLAKPDSDLRKEVSRLIKEVPYFSSRPDGIRAAVDAAKTVLEAKAAPDLRKRLADYEKELTTLRTATSPGRGSPEDRGNISKPFEQMNDAEQVEYIRSQAAQADAA